MMISSSLDYLTLLYLAVTLPCAAERLPPPRNVSYAWLDPFLVNLTWLADRPPPGCSPLKFRLWGTHPGAVTTWDLFRLVPVVAGLGSDVRITLRTVGEGQSAPCQRYNDSEEVSVIVPRQDGLVSDFRFFLYPACDRPDARLPFCGLQANWTPVAGTPRLQMFYRSCSAVSANLTACQVFDSGGRGQGCHLAGLEIGQDACIVFQEEHDAARRYQTFQRNPNKHIRTLRPDVAVTKQGHYLNVTWHHANVCNLIFWQYRVNYSECGRPAKEKVSDYGVDSVLVPFDEQCRYELQVQPLLMKECGEALADISALLVYNDGASRGLSAVVVLVAVPAILSAVVLVLCCYVRRKTKAIFKNIPAPPSALKEMMSSIHQRQEQLVVPTPQEVDVCVVSPPEEDKEDEEQREEQQQKEEEEEVDLLVLEVT